jgi:hypothetical protein
MRVKAKQINSHHLTTFCFGLLIASILAYMYFLSLSVVHVVMRKEASSQISNLRSEIANLEADYIEAKHVISARVASAEGFNQTENKIFINRNEGSLVLRTNRD